MGLWKVEIQDTPTFTSPITFFSALKIRPEAKAYDKQWLVDVLSHDDYIKHKAIKRVTAPDGRVFKNYAFTALIARPRKEAVKELCCAEKRVLNLMPEEIGILCALSEEDKVGIFGLGRKEFRDICVKDPTALIVTMIMLRRKPEAWNTVHIFEGI